MIKFLVIASVLVASCLAEARLLRSRPLPDGRIVGGEEADIEDYPYQVSFEYFGSHRCGGAIISKDWVVTAAHCVDGVSVGNVAFRAGSSTRGGNGSLHPASQIIAHPRYNYRNFENDIAVVKVSVPFGCGPGVRAIGLARFEPRDGVISVVSGWGTLSSGGSLPTTLQVVRVPIVSRANCNRDYAAYGGITASMLCAGVENVGGKDACQGDSGGPLVVDGELAGVVSWGVGCAEARFPGVYANVAHLRDFVVNSTGVL